MAMKSDQPYQDLEPFSHPPRSRLFCVEPVEIGTQLGESLTSLTTRLAEAHCLPLGLLMKKEVAPIIARTYGGGNLDNIYNHTAALNGTGVMASSLASALEKLTGQKNLYLLALIAWSELIPSRRLLRRKRAWCPCCYEDWRTAKYIIYEPLLWCLEVVKVCPTHRLLLCEICPYCQQENLPLAWHSRAGYCSKCHQWLGLPGHSLSNPKNLSEDELQTLTWMAVSVGDLLASTPYLASLITKENLAQAFRFHVSVICGGNTAEFARQLQLPKNTVCLWCNGKNMPQLDALVRVCHRLNRPLMEFITEEPQQNIYITVAKTPVSLQFKPKSEAKTIDTDLLEQQLEAIFLDHGCPPPPMEEVARRLKIHRETIFRHLPDLCRAISAKYDKFQKVRQSRAIEQSREEVKQAVLKLCTEGLYPSEGSVAKFMSQPGYLRYKKVRAAIEEAKQEFSFKEKN